MIRLRFSIEVDYYDEYITQIEILIENMANEHKSKTNISLENSSELDKDDILQSAHYRLNILENITPNIHRKSCLICLYSLLETKLMQICKIQESASDNPVKIEDLESKGIIDRARKYLSKVSRLKFPNKTDQWREILKIQQIRNICVHSNGVLKKKNDTEYYNIDLAHYIQNTDYLSLLDSGEVIINKGYCAHCLETINNFFLILFNELEEVNTKKIELISV